jgi:hypothetical protein
VRADQPRQILNGDVGQLDASQRLEIVEWNRLSRLRLLAAE